MWTGRSMCLKIARDTHNTINHLIANNNIQINSSLKSEKRNLLMTELRNLKVRISMKRIMMKMMMTIMKMNNFSQIRIQ